MTACLSSDWYIVRLQISPPSLAASIIISLTDALQAATS